MKRVGIAILGLSAALFAQENLSQWAKYKTITINTKASGANVATNVSKFPVLVRLDSTNAADVFATSGGALAGGADIRFSNSTGTAQRPFEIELWNATTKQAAIWVLADTVKGNDSVATLRLYWGNSAATAASNPSAVYDTSNSFVGNWHLGNAAGTANRPNAVSGAPAAVLRKYKAGYNAVPGIAGLADTVFGDMGDSTADSARYIDMRSSNVNPYKGYKDFTKGFTFSTWIRPTTLTQFVRVIEMLEDSTKVIANVSPTRFVLFLNHTSAANGVSVRWGSQASYNGLANQFVNGTWKHLTVSHPGGTTAAPAVIYLDGDSVGVTPAYTTLDTVNRPYVRLGRSFSTDAFFNGKFDEVAIANARRSNAWTKLSFQTQKTNANAVLLGATQNNNAPDTSTENYSTWTKNRTIWLNTANNRVGAAKIGANVTKFPVLIRIAANDTAFTQAKGGGADLRFAKANGTTALPYQIEQWNSNGAAVWVLVDTVKANDSLQTIRMLWGNAAANSRSNGAAVFSTANGFTAVWHLNDSAAQASAGGQSVTATPSTPAPVPATAANSLIGGAKVFNGTTNWYEIGTDSTALNLNTNAGPYTVSAWVNPSSCANRIAAIAKYTNPGSRQWALHTSAANGSWRFTNAPNGLNATAAGEFAADGSTCTEGAWTYVVGTYATPGTLTAESSVNAKLFVDGALAGSGTHVALDSATINNRARAYIGRIASNERYMNGTLDEVRVHGVARDSNWIKLEYANQRANQTFAVLAKQPIVGLNAFASQSAFGLSVKPSLNGLQFRVNGLAAGDKAVLSLVDMFGRTVYGASFTGDALSWNGMNDNGQALSSGVYVARVKVLDAQGQIRKVLEHKLPLAR